MYCVSIIWATEISSFLRKILVFLTDTSVPACILKWDCFHWNRDESYIPKCQNRMSTLLVWHQLKNVYSHILEHSAESPSLHGRSPAEACLKQYLEKHFSSRDMLFHKNWIISELCCWGQVISPEYNISSWSLRFLVECICWVIF